METQHSHSKAYSADYILNLWNSEKGKINKSKFVTYKNTPLEIIEALCNDPDWSISVPAKRRKNAELKNLENLNNLSVEDLVQKMGISACAGELILRSDSSVAKELFSKFNEIKPVVNEFFSIEKLKEENSSLDSALDRLTEKYTNLVVECDEQKEKYEEKLAKSALYGQNQHRIFSENISALKYENKRLSELTENYCSDNIKLEKKVNHLEQDYKTELEHKKHLLGRGIKLYDVISQQQNTLSVYAKINSEVKESYIEMLQNVENKLFEISKKKVQETLDNVFFALMLTPLEDFEIYDDDAEIDDALDYDIEIEYQQSEVDPEKWQYELMVELENSQVADTGQEDCENTQLEEKSIVGSFKEKFNELKNKFI
jgi:hypothetical protein